jgi:hypothetical protein
MLARGAAVELHEQYTKLIEQLQRGDHLANAPWGDPRFQEMVVRAFANAASDKRKLADMEAGGRHLRALLGL